MILSDVLLLIDALNPVAAWPNRRWSYEWNFNYILLFYVDVISYPYLTLDAGLIE